MGLIQKLQWKKFNGMFDAYKKIIAIDKFFGIFYPYKKNLQWINFNGMFDAYKTKVAITKY